jgi:hypothetical protein
MPRVELTTTYNATAGFSVAAHFGVSKSYYDMSFNATLAASDNATYVYTWSDAGFANPADEFILYPGEACTPSMVIIDIACDITGGAYRFDTWYNKSDTSISLDHEQHRRGGPYRDGQWCDERQLNVSAFRAQRKHWRDVEPTGLRPLVFAHNATALNAYLEHGSSPLCGRRPGRVPPSERLTASTTASSSAARRCRATVALCAFR